MRATFVNYGMSSGGAERVISLLSGAWAAKGWGITILTFKDEPSFYPLDSRVVHRGLGIASDGGEQTSSSKLPLWNDVQSVRTLRAALLKSRPDIVISFQPSGNINTLLATMGLKVPVIISERNNPQKERISWKRGLLRKKIYGRATRFVAQTQGILKMFPAQVQRIGTIIPNPVVLPDLDAEVIRASWDNGSRQKKVIAMGRLVEQKGFDLLLKAWVHVQTKYPDWTLEIWGESNNAEENARPRLEKLRDELGLTNRVQMPGVTSEPFAKMREASVFVLSSRYEGLPNALCEAMANGCACVSYDCPTGPRELIRNGYDGLLVPCEDVQALARALDRLLGDRQLQRTLGQNAPEVLERFALPRIIHMWENVFEEVTGRKSLHAK